MVYTRIINFSKTSTKSLKVLYSVILVLTISIGLGNPLPEINQRTDTAFVRLSKENQSLRQDLEKFKADTDKQYEKQGRIIDTSTYALAIFSLLFAILAFFLSSYISRIHAQIVQAADKQDKSNANAIAAEKKAQDLHDLMQKNLGALFDQMKRTETENILKRLINVPEDICNLGHLLASRDLESEDFNLLHIAFAKNLALRYSVPDNGYAVVFFQHFPYEAIMTEEIRSFILPKISQLINSSFENDMNKSLPNSIKGFIGLGMSAFSDDIRKFSTGFQYSKYHNSERCYDIMVRSFQNSAQCIEYYNCLRPFDDSTLSEFRANLLATAFKVFSPIPEDQVEFFQTEIVLASSEWEKRSKELTALSSTS